MEATKPRGQPFSLIFKVKGREESFPLQTQGPVLLMKQTVLVPRAMASWTLGSLVHGLQPSQQLRTHMQPYRLLHTDTELCRLIGCSHNNVKSVFPSVLTFDYHFSFFKLSVCAHFPR
jgi:hypothetical protein